LIEVAPEDAMSDDGREVFNLLEHGGIENVVVMGVHTNLCVLRRPYGIRQLVYLGKKPLLCRDLTDSFHRDPRPGWRLARNGRVQHDLRLDLAAAPFSRES
jgi:nicotinamidase-related amidase